MMMQPSTVRTGFLAAAMVPGRLAKAARYYLEQPLRRRAIGRNNSRFLVGYSSGQAIGWRIDGCGGWRGERVRPPGIGPVRDAIAGCVGGEGVGPLVAGLRPAQPVLALHKAERCANRS